MTVSLPELLVTLVLLSFLWVLIDSVLERFRDRRAARQSAGVVRECHLCGRSYPEQRKVKISVCPHCGAQNRRGGHRKLG